MFFWIRLFMYLPTGLTRTIARTIVGVMKMIGLQKKKDFLNYI